jgi:hypothetical protein
MLGDMEWAGEFTIDDWLDVHEATPGDHATECAEKLATLAVGEVVAFGGGAAPEVRVRRVA